MKPNRAARPPATAGAPGKQLPTRANHTPGAESTQRLSLNSVIGTRDASAWQPVRGITWIQTRCPLFARKLTQRHDSRLVARGVEGGYLRTFEFRHSLTWARRLILRYTGNGTATNAPLERATTPAGASKARGRGQRAKARHDDLRD
ncbi:MAG: hypothetical protein HYY24_22150 [Verrucomicrobia bacterium]|nr:hypothetical protein [Verrucomicrobiota bacterium]